MQSNLKKNVFTILLSLIFLVSCKELNRDKEIKKFPETISLKGIANKKISIHSSGNVNLVVLDTFLILQKDEDHILSIYSTNTHEKLAEFGKNGNGPGEFKFPMLLKYSPDKSSVATMYDLVRRRFSKINLHEAILKKEKAIDQEHLSEIEDFFVYFFHRDESLLIATPEVGGRFLIYDDLNNTKKYVPFLPELDMPISDYMKMDIYRSAVVVNKKKNKFVAAPLLLNELNFFDLKGNYLNSTIMTPREEIKKTFPSLSKGKFNPEIKQFITSIEEANDTLYAMNTDTKISEFRDPSKTKPMKLQLFDWDGNPIREYVFADGRRIISFAYDKIHRRVYAYSTEEEDYNIIMYDLK